jgi:hypothetical protein
LFLLKGLALYALLLLRRFSFKQPPLCVFDFLRLADNSRRDVFDVLPSPKPRVDVLALGSNVNLAKLDSSSIL